MVLLLSFAAVFGSPVKVRRNLLRGSKTHDLEISSQGCTQPDASSEFEKLKSHPLAGYLDLPFIEKMGGTVEEKRNLYLKAIARVETFTSVPRKGTILRPRDLLGKDWHEVPDHSVAAQPSDKQTVFPKPDTPKPVNTSPVTAGSLARVRGTREEWAETWTKADAMAEDLEPMS